MVEAFNYSRGEAVFNASGLQYYRHADWLGTARFASTATGSVQYDRAYAPYGEAYADMGSWERVFAGQTQDLVHVRVAHRFALISLICLQCGCPTV